MAFEEGGSRIDDLKLVVSRVAMAASLFDQDGIQVRFQGFLFPFPGVLISLDLLDRSGS